MPSIYVLITATDRNLELILMYHVMLWHFKTSMSFNENGWLVELCSR